MGHLAIRTAIYILLFSIPTPFLSSAIAEQFPLKHQIQLNPIGTLPASIRVEAPSSIPLTHVRALLFIDQQLLTLPLTLDSKSEQYVGRFPSPIESLDYQIQIIDGKGRSMVSSTLQVAPTCDIDSNQQIRQQRETFTSQKTLVKEAIVVNEKIIKLQNSIAALQKIASFGMPTVGQRNK
jgi:hypothetical protein